MTLKFRPIHIAIATLVGSYVATTGLGAALFPFQFGREQLAAFLYPEPVPFSWMITLGSPLYWTLLLSMIVLPPAAAFASEKIAARIAPSIRPIAIPTWIPLALAGAMSSYCIYKLAMAGALSAHEAWDRSVCYEGKILRRVALFDLLGTRYYSFTYSSLPILGSYLLAQGVVRKDRVALIGFWIFSALIIWFNLATMMKANAIIYIGTLGLTLVFCGFGLFRSIAIAAPAAVGMYIALSVMQFCNTQVASWEAAKPPPSSTTSALGDELSAARDKSSAPITQATPAFLTKSGYMIRAATFRMAAGFPYYVQMFSDADQRCGIELPPHLGLPRQTCFGPIKIFSKMYPGVTYITGFQPGPMNVSAYGEAGLWYAIIVTIACGLIIGAVCSFAGFDGPLPITITVACSIYAYYASQVSLTSSLLDSYGLAWLLFPIGAMLIIQMIGPVQPLS